MGGGWLVGLGAMALATGCLVTSYCDGQCEDVVVVSMPLPRPASPGPAPTLDGATVELCRNNHCARGTFGAGISDQSSLQLVGATSCGAMARVQSGADGTPAIAIRATPSTACEPDLRDGDVFTLTISAPDGALLVHGGQAVTYTTHTTCGMSCRTAMVTL